MVKVIPEHIYEVQCTVSCTVRAGADDTGVLIMLVDPGEPRSFVASSKERVCV